MSDIDPTKAAVDAFMESFADEADQRPEPPHLVEIGDTVRGILAITSDVLEACGLEAQANSLRRCRVRLPGTPHCTLRAANACDTTVRMIWGSEGMLSASSRVACLEAISLSSSALFAVTPGVTSDLKPWLQSVWTRSQQVRFLVRGMTGR